MANQNSTLRLVGAGIRVVKITKAQTEGGLVRVFCNPASRPTPNNFDKYFDASVNSKYLKRGYVAS